MSVQVILSGVLVALITAAVTASAVWAWRHSFPKTRARHQRWREFSNQLRDVATRASESVAACIKHNDPAVDPTGLNDPHSTMRRIALHGFVESFDGLLPDVAGYYDFDVTLLVKDLRDACDRAWARKRGDADADLPDRAALLARQVTSAAARGPAVRHIVGFDRRKREYERYAVLTGLLEASARAEHLLTESIQSHDPVWYSLPNSERGQTAESMIRMYALRQAGEHLASLGARAAALGWAEPTRVTEAFSAMCTGQDAEGRPESLAEDCATLAQGLRDALAGLPERERGPETRTMLPSAGS